MTELFNSFDTVLSQAAPKIASRLQPGLTIDRIEAQIAGYSWTLPQAAFDLYRWHNGLSGQPGKLNLVEKLLRVKGKWHGELSGRENEIHLQLGERLIIAKFLPLDYALAGHRHLKLDPSGNLYPILCNGFDHYILLNIFVVFHRSHWGLS